MGTESKGLRMQMDGHDANRLFSMRNVIYQKGKVFALAVFTSIFSTTERQVFIFALNIGTMGDNLMI